MLCSQYGVGFMLTIDFAAVSGGFVSVAGGTFGINKGREKGREKWGGMEGREKKRWMG